ncbi:MAG: hypothetical protein Fur0011_2900 [Candidatus Microgenomates bacterium]
MGGVNLYIENRYIGWGELIVGAIGIVNLLFYLKNRNLDRASHVVLFSTLILLSAIMIDGGIKETGWMWIFLYPTIAFALRNVKTASIYVSFFGFYLAGLTVVELLGYDLSVYGRTGLIQLCVAYGVLSAMLLFTERAHEQISLDNEQQKAELAHEKTVLWQQRDQLRIFKTAVEQSGEMMILTDPEGIVLWANKATENVTGFRVKEAIGLKAGVLWGKMMDKDYYIRLWDTIKNKKQLFSGEIQNHRKNGDHFYSTINIYPLLDREGKIQYYVATQRDITEQKEVDQMKTDFVSLVSHQLRTPLSSMRWNLEMLLAGDIGKLSIKQKAVVKSIEEANARMIKLISTLLNISRIESGRLIVEPEEIDLVAYFGELSKHCQSNVKGQKLVLKMPKGPYNVVVDPMLLRQIVNNFVNNASKYSPADKPIEVKLEDMSDKYLISVTDHGIGIPQSEQRKIFGKFFRASNVSKHETDGTGMGLYIGSMLVKLLGGTIDFESIENVGTTFRVTLPKKGVPAVAGEVKLV